VKCQRRERPLWREEERERREREREREERRRRKKTTERNNPVVVERGEQEEQVD